MNKNADEEVVMADLRVRCWVAVRAINGKELEEGAPTSSIWVDSNPELGDEVVLSVNGTSYLVDAGAMARAVLKASDCE